MTFISVCSVYISANQTKLYKPVFTFIITLTAHSTHLPAQNLRHNKRTNMGCGETVACWKHVILGIALGLFNFISTLVNIYYLYNEDHKLFASLSLFLLWFPGRTILSGENIFI